MIAIITYDHPHRKTQDLVFRLVMYGNKELTLLALPWEERARHNPICEHRPRGCINVPVGLFCERLGLNFVSVKDYKALEGELHKYRHIIVGGAGLLPASTVEQFNIINAHPGYLPNVRGLDALKWAVYEGQPIGVTLHRVSSDPDSGFLVDRHIVPVYFEDTFHSVAMRVYNTEIDMLAGSVKMGVGRETLKDTRYKVHGRMSHHLEPIMRFRFERLRKSSGSWRDADERF